MDQKTILINQMLDLIQEASFPMPDVLFSWLEKHEDRIAEKPFFNLIADSFLTLFAFCLLMRNHSWSQASALLRMGIEQVSTVWLCADNPNMLDSFLRIAKEKEAYWRMDREEEKRVFRKEKGLYSSNRVHLYFDYGWIKPFTKDGTYGRKQIIELANMEEFIPDIENTLNAFSHGSLSIFQFSKDNWELMKRHGRRTSLICCKLFDFLCCSLDRVLGYDFRASRAHDLYLSFRDIYRNGPFFEKDE